MGQTQPYVLDVSMTQKQAHWNEMDPKAGQTRRSLYRNAWNLGSIAHLTTSSTSSKTKLLHAHLQLRAMLMHYQSHPLFDMHIVLSPWTTSAPLIGPWVQGHTNTTQSTGLLCFPSRMSWKAPNVPTGMRLLWDWKFRK